MSEYTTLTPRKSPRLKKKVGDVPTNNNNDTSTTKKKRSLFLDYLPPVSNDTAQKVNFALCIVLVSLGIFSATPLLWYKNWVKAYCYWVGGSLSTAAIFQLFAGQVGRLIQTSANARKESVMNEVLETLYGFGIVTASLTATPLTQSSLGQPTAFRESLYECVPFGSVVLYILKAVMGLVIADGYNYWKHRCFHHRSVWAFHKTHHSHHNPTAVAGFAVCPMYALATFWPLALFSLPQLGLYLPLHWPILAFYMILNHYLHCGYTIDVLEKIFVPLHIMSSGWHNVHHEKGRVGWDYKAQTFGEMFTIWDVWMGTHANGMYLYSGGAK